MPLHLRKSKLKIHRANFQFVNEDLLHEVKGHQRQERSLNWLMLEVAGLQNHLHVVSPNPRP